jgi:hypothetical protein
MAFFNYVNQSLARSHPLASPLLSAGRRDAAVWFGPEISCGATCFICDMRPSTGCRGVFAQAVAAGPKRNLGPLSTMGSFFVDRNLGEIGPRPCPPPPPGPRATLPHPAQPSSSSLDLCLYPGRGGERRGGSERPRNGGQYRKSPPLASGSGLLASGLWLWPL